MHMTATRNHHVQYFPGNKAWSFSPSPVTVLTELSPFNLYVSLKNTTFWDVSPCCLTEI